MIVLLNTLITSNRLNQYRQNIGSHFPIHNRLDIFKYCIASYVAMDPLISKYVLFVNLSDEFKPYQEELNQFIIDTIPVEKLILEWRQLNYIHEWVDVCSLIDTFDDEMIWLACNDDHIFIDSNLDTVKDGLNILKQDPDPMATIYYSHFPEIIKMAKHCNAKLVDGGNYVNFTWSRFDSIQIIKQDRLKKYWIDFDGDSRLWYRSDDMLYMRSIPSSFYAPTKEIVRHFDGYGHVGNFTNITPSLCIPPGFFSSSLKIRYGFDGHENGWTSLNPMAPTLYSIDPNGSDYRWCVSDIPLFWLPKISEIKYSNNIDDTALINSRNLYFLESTKTCPWAYDIQFTDDDISPMEWHASHFL